MLRYRRDLRYLQRRTPHGRGVRAMLERELEGVDGWLFLDEASALHEAARTAGPGDRPPRVVEIGSWQGRSTIALAKGLEARERPDGTVLAIDPHTGSREHHELWGEIDTFEAFKANLERAGVAGRVVPARSFSQEARREYDGGPIDVLFIDGSHEYEDVRLDFRDWLPLLAPGGVVAINDVVWPGVWRALHEGVIRPASGLHSPALIDNTLFMTYSPDPPDARRRRRLALFRLELALRYLLAQAMLAVQRRRGGAGEAGGAA